MAEEKKDYNPKYLYSAPASAAFDTGPLPNVDLIVDNDLAPQILDSTEEHYFN